MSNVGNARKISYRWPDEEVTPEFIAYKQIQWRNDFWRWFTECVYTIDEADIDDPVKAAPPYKYLNIFHETIEDNRTTIVVKARQLFFTWYMAARFVHNFMFKPYSRSIFMSQKQDQVEDVIKNRMVAIIQNLDPRFPWPEMKDRVHIKSLSLRHPSDNVRTLIVGTPAGEDQARGMTGTEIWLDEFGFQDYQEKVLKTIRPLVRKAKTKLIITSTPNPQTHYEELVKDASTSEMDEKMPGVWFNRNKQDDAILYVRYDAHPNQRSPEWAEQTKLEVGDLTWRVEYNLEWIMPTGKPVFANFDKATYCVPYKAHGTWTRDFAVEMGYDFGGHYPACVYFHKDTLGRIIVHRAIMAEGEDLEVFLERTENALYETFPGCERFNLYCDPAGAAVNGQGTAPPAAQILQEYFNKPVKYFTKTSPSERVTAMKLVMNQRKGNTMGMILHPNLGELYSPDGEVSHGIMIEGFQHGYVYEKKKTQLHYKDLTPKKDGLFDHLFDAYGYAFILVCPASFKQSQRAGAKTKDVTVYKAKKTYIRK